MLASGPDLRPVGLLTVTHSTGTTAAEGQRVVLAPALPVLMGGRRLGGSPDVRECRLHPYFTAMSSINRMSGSLARRLGPYSPRAAGMAPFR